VLFNDGIDDPTQPIGFHFLAGVVNEYALWCARPILGLARHRIAILACQGPTVARNAPPDGALDRLLIVLAASSWERRPAAIQFIRGRRPLLLEMLRVQLVAAEQLVEIRAIAFREACGLAHVACRDL
jgi:hypothetical protein